MMTNAPEQHVFIVDGELEALQAVCKTLASLGAEITCFVNPGRCLERLRAQKCDLLIAELKIPEMDGIELVTNAKRVAPWVPVLVITGHGDVPAAVRAIKAGAVDFIEKPLDKGSLVKTVKSILQKGTAPNGYVDKPLTWTENTILKLVIDGKSNREISELLGLSVRTIEVHRANMMEKLGVNNLLDLIKRAIALGLVDVPANQEPGETTQNAEPA
ncbi:MAG: response regulator transcription factor [Planctomycetota bacterium]|jgi:FixJ family two-component response regulator